MAVAGTYHLVLGAFMFGRPSQFADLVGNYGARNDHFVRDNAATNLAFAVAFIAATRRPAWTVPLLLVVVTQYGFHTISHVIDASAASTTTLGIAAAATLGTATAAGAIWLRRVAKVER